MDFRQDPQVGYIPSSSEEEGGLSPLLQKEGRQRGDGMQSSNVVGRFPGSIKYLVWNEFCERFSFYGMKTILALYLLEHLRLSENQSTEMVHLFIVMSYATTVIGAVLSDSFWGKYRTILYLSVVYCAGNWVMASSASFPATASSTSTSAFWAASTGLILIAFGTGGIKPCVAAFGGDQIAYSLADGHVKDQIQRQFFSLYYFAINSGSFISTLLTPVLRARFSYTVAFAVPAVLMMCALFVFLLGQQTYIDVPPSGNILTDFFTIILDGIKLKMARKQDYLSRSGREEATNTVQLARAKQPRHWLDAATAKHDKTAVEDVKTVLRLLLFLLPTPLFWSLSDQQSSKWVFQAQRLDGRISWLGGLEIQPDQMQAFNPVFILLLIPLFDRAIYPLLEKGGIPLKPIWRMALGMLLTSLAFVLSALLQLAIDSHSDAHLTFLSSSHAFSQTGMAGMPNTTSSLSILWQVPQYFLITVGEILFSITGLEFAYSQAPQSMKSLIQSAWLFTVSAGNLLTVIIVAAIGNRLSKANEFFFFAGGCLVAMLLMIWLGSGFIYKSLPSPPSEEDPLLTDSTETQVSIT
ncbi:hypothetical protein O6H91_19G021100 [Diphasiastrum complanatum]|uniref:Uncharacterized protein n=1 Tax=Diphasiastrum complanatum TaxID=34168 RepID=A0ACC2AT97_DIPCM|nr:hypothetical protein O6H91_19G021100 [Diphasiastrum complanatum]